MLIDWEPAGPDRRFEIMAPDVQKASSFYKNVLGARETFRKATHNGELVRLGLAIGQVGFVIFSKKEAGEEPPLFSLLAADLGAPYVAIILKVEAPDYIAFIAKQHGAKLIMTPESETIVIVDPFGCHWALVKHENHSA